ncbi:AraC family transcriptional regulator [Nocardia sp. NBC_00511]|uniref:AraC family transcriptional regulator n=1 Tax=Nocardia sp. NBC_00511 TaxID=2903591 RepID=UPI0030E0C96B
MAASNERPSPPGSVVPSLPWRFNTRTPDLDEASAQGTEAYYPLRMSVLSRGDKFRMSIDAMQLGPIMLGDCLFDADIRMEFADLRTFYHLNIPLSGHLDSQHRGHEVTATPRQAVLYGPTGNILLSHWGAGSRILCIKIRRDALEAELTRLLQRAVRTPIRLGPTVDLTDGYGRSLRLLARLLAEQVRVDDPLTRQELIGAELWHSLLAHLLAAADHDLRDELLHPATRCRPRAVVRVIDAMQAEPQTVFTAARLAEIAGVSVRSVQTAFQAHVGVPPMAYLRNLRLERVHAELVASESARTNVTNVAIRWGFTHPGRFAQAYMQRYGTLPSQTLSRSAPG